VDAEFKDFEDPVLWSPQQIDRVTSELHRGIIAALDKVGPVIPYKPKKALFSWWCAELDELRKLARTAHNHACCRPSEYECCEAYNKGCKALKNTSCKARTASWRAFTAEQVSPKQAARLNRILQRKAYNKLGLLKKDDGTLTGSIQESYLLLMKEHFPGCQVITQVAYTQSSEPDPLGATGRSVNPVLVEKRPWIKLATLDRAFRQFGNMKCAGPDGFKPIVLKHLPQSERIILFYIYNASIDLQYTPLSGGMRKLSLFTGIVRRLRDGHGTIC
jgi:hypothetical protein